jgi:hypothetical protein
MFYLKKALKLAELVLFTICRNKTWFFWRCCWSNYFFRILLSKLFRIRNTGTDLAYPRQFNPFHLSQVKHNKF